MSDDEKYDLEERIESTAGSVPKEQDARVTEAPRHAPVSPTPQQMHGRKMPVPELVPSQAPPLVVLDLMNQ
jgi:hypothetical protein